MSAAPSPGVSTNLDGLLALLDTGVLLLLPNTRAASNLRSAYDARQRALGTPAWQPANVFSWSQWTHASYTDLILAGHEQRLLLNTAQQQSLWREIISTYAAAIQSITSADSLATLATSAWNLAATHNAIPQLRSGNTTTANSYDSRIFIDWAATFAKHCTTRSYLSPALLEDALQQHLQSANLPAPPALHLVGFETLTPAQSSLLGALRTAGTSITHHTLTAIPLPNALRSNITAANPHEELQLAALWARRHLEQNPTTTVAILLPNPAEDRPEFDSILRETLAPELQSITADLSSTPWEWSTGEPLSTLRMVADAIALIRWSTGPISMERASSLLLSPYLGAPEARNLTASFDVAALRRLKPLRPEIDISSVLSLVGPFFSRLQRDSAPDDAVSTSPIPWLQSLQGFLQRESDLVRPRSFADWTEHLRRLLKAASWPSAVGTASEFETTVAWESALDLLATLDFAGRRVSLATALDELDRLCQSTPFTQRSNHAPVQILSVSESEGSLFDAVLYLRCTDANLPAPERTHPFLPWTLQRTLHMPGTDPSRSSSEALATTQSLIARSNSILFTHAAEDATGKLRPSPLLSSLEELVILNEGKDLLLGTSDETIPFETHTDDSPIPPLPTSEAHGGATVLKLQAACAFLAFAQLRLRSTTPDTTDLGLDSGESGNLLHRALQDFWSKVGSQQNLRSMSPTERHEMLAFSIDYALPQNIRAESNWDRAYLTLQKDRLLSLLDQWLDLELLRSPFTVVGLEKEELVTLGPLTLKVRMDRIDQLESGGTVFVDYKTGAAADPKLWEGTRPDEPQLPLYTLLTEPSELKGLAFGSVRSGKYMRWHGFQSESDIFPKPGRDATRDLAPLVEEWRLTLTHLAEDFASGYAAVDPKNFPTTCAHCEQRLLCRLDPASLLNQFTDPDNGADTT